MLDEDEKGVTRCYTLGGEQDMNIINESGLYNLIFRSNKPEEKAFRKWVTSEVLPQIRKTGAYHPGNETPDAIKQELSELGSRLKGLERALAREKAVMKKPFWGSSRHADLYEKLPEKYRAAAEGRRQVILAYDASGLNVTQFVNAYAAGKIVPELRAMLGPHGDIVSKSSLYRWMDRYEQLGLWGLVPRYIVLEIRDTGGTA